MIRCLETSTLVSACVLMVACADAYVGVQPPPPFVQAPPLPYDVPPDPKNAPPLLRPGSAPMGLAGVIRLVVLGDPRIRAAVQTVMQARADLVTAQLLPNPSLSASVSLVPLPGAPFNAETRQGGPPQMDVGLSYALDTIVFGKRSAASAEARQAVDVALADLAELARERIIEGIVAYFDVLEARELARLAREEMDQLERLHTITERRVGLGSVGQIELDRIRLAAISGRRRVLSVDAEVDNALSRLRARVGGEGEAMDVAGGLDLDHPPAPVSAAHLLPIAEKSRPDQVSLRAQVRRSQAAVVTAQRNGRPNLSLSVGFTRQFQETAIGFPDASSVGAGMEVSLPIFDRNQGNVAKAHASVRQSEALLDAGRVDLRSEVEQATRSYRVAYETVTTFDVQSLQAAQAARGRVEEAYSLGGRTLLEVLDAQAAYRDVFRQHVSARADLLRAMHRLNAVAGSPVLR